MDSREHRGIFIAALKRIEHKDGKWHVPSESTRNRVYHVNLTLGTCTCDDFGDFGQKCKHIYAAEITQRRNGQTAETFVETGDLQPPEKKKRFRNWAGYNVGQQDEKDRFQELLFDLCRRLPERPRKRGRPRTPTSDMVFATVLKVYTMLSTRRFACDLKGAFKNGYLTKLMNSISIASYMESEDLSPILKDLVIQSSLPLKAVETHFAPDSTGFSVSRFVRWMDEKYGTERSGRDWVKAHIICGVKTNVVTAIEIQHREAGDAPLFRPLVETTAKSFTVKNVSADKAYLSNENLELVQTLGGTAYIPFKSNSTEGEAGSLWQKAWLHFMYHREEFLKHYHQRSNIETTNSMVKAKFGDSVRSRTDPAMKNEVYCKFICHNICCLIRAQSELGITPADAADASVDTDAIYA